MKMKMKKKMEQILTRILVFAMVVTGVPVAAMNGVDVQNVLADENESGTQEETSVYRYRAIPNMTVKADWDTEQNGGIGNLLDDSMAWTMSRFNTGNKPISTEFNKNNNIFIGVKSGTAKVESLRYYPGIDISNGTILRMNVWAIMDPAPANFSADDTSWKLVAENVKFDLEKQDGTEKKTGEDKEYPYYKVDLGKALDVGALRIEVLNSYGEYHPEDKLYQIDKFITGAELEVYDGNAQKISNGSLNFDAEFDCDADSPKGNLWDGDYATKMHSSQTESAKMVTAQDPGKFVSNNNMYFELPEQTLVGRLTYVAGAPNGNIARARIYATTAQTPDGEGPEAIADSKWTKVFDNTDANVEEWKPYVRSGGISANDRIAEFAPIQAKYVRMEVVTTHFGDFAEYGNEHKPDNKWISGRRIYIYEAEKVEEPIENIASKNPKSGEISTKIQAYTGAEGENNDPEMAIDENSETLSNGAVVNDIDRDMNKITELGITDTTGGIANGGTMWQSAVEMKGSGANGAQTDKASCIILDLGEGTTSEIEDIRIRWWNWLSGVDYVIETSDTCSLVGDITKLAGFTDGVTAEKIRNADKDAEGNSVWRTVAEVSGASTATANPLHEFAQNKTGNWNLKTTSLSRYVRILVTKMNPGAAGTSIRIREIEINGRRSKKVSTVNLEWRFAAIDHTPAEGLKTYTYGDDPRYGSDFRYPTAVRGASYFVNKDSQKVEESTDGKVWKDITETAHGFFDFGKYYRLSATIESGTADFADVVNVKLVKVDGSTEGLLAVENNGDKKTITVSRVFRPINDYTTDYKALDTWFKGEGSKDIRERYAEGQGTASKRNWDRFVNIYDHVEQCLLRDFVGEQVGITAPTGLRRGDYENAKDDLERAYSLLTGQIMIIDQKVQTAIKAPVPGEAPGEAQPLNSGSLLIKPEGLAYESGDHSFSVEDGGVIKGDVKFPNTDSEGNPANQIFNVNGSTQFIMDFDLYMDKAATKTESIIGRLNNQYGVQIKGGQLIVFGRAGNSWPQTSYTLNSEFYGTWHDIVIIYDGEEGYFRMFVDGEEANDDRPNAHGQLSDDGNNSTFGIGYNPDRRVDTAGSNHEDEWFSGKLRNVRMFIQQEGADDDFPKWQGVVTAQTPQEQKQLLRNLLDDKNIEAELEIGGDSTQTFSTQTKWSPQDEVFHKYQDYKLEVTATPTSGYEFKNGLEAELAVTGESPYTVSKTSVTSQGPDIIITYEFKHPKHPVEDLSEYLEGLNDVLKTDAPDKNEKTTNGTKERVYTKATWGAFESEYTTAIALSETGVVEGTEKTCEDALTSLTAAVNALLEAKDNCECTITSISLTSSDISLEASSADVALNAEYETNDVDCLVHHGKGKAAATINYAIAEGDGIATVDNSTGTLTVAGEGTVKITATATLENGETKATDTPAVYTVTSPKVNKGDQAASDLKEKYDAVSGAYTESNYDPENWDKLDQALKDAEQLLKDLEEGKDVTAYQVSQAMDKIDAAKQELDAEGINKLIDLMDDIAALNPDAYDAASWNDMKAIYDQAAEELENGNPDPGKCAALLTQLKNLKDNLKPASSKPPVDTPKVDPNVVKDGQTFTIASGTYKVESAKDKTVTITKGVDAKVINVGPTVVINKDTYKVIGIGNGAFTGLKNVTKVVIGDNVTSIGDKAFTGCAKLKNVTIGKDVTTIGKQAFFKCKKLSKVTVKNNSKLSKVGASAFKKTAKNIKIKLPKNLKKNKNLKKQIKKAGIKKGL